MCRAGAMRSTLLFCCKSHEAYSCVVQEPCGLLVYFAAIAMHEAFSCLVQEPCGLLVYLAARVMRLTNVWCRSHVVY